jgi:hypothetical protein
VKRFALPAGDERTNSFLAASAIRRGLWPL